MNDAIGVDASLAVKWVLDEEYTEQAQRLWSDSLAARRPVIAPPHFTGEVTSALYQRTRRTDPDVHLDVSEASEALADFLQYPVEVLAHLDLYPRAFAFAHTHGLPNIYDSLYVVFAQMLDVELWTADERLFHAITRVAPWVRLIRDYPL